MKPLRFFLMLALALGLLAVTPHALARPAEAPPAEETSTSTPPAPTIQDKMATLQATQKQGRAGFYIGTISAVDAAGFTLTLRDGSSASMTLHPNARVLAIGSDGASRPGGLNVGQSVMVRAILGADGSLTARIILAMRSQPVRMHLIGTVTAYTPGQSITIQAMDGKSYTFAITGGTNILPPDAAGLAVGARVTIVAPREGQTALGIVVAPAGP